MQDLLQKNATHVYELIANSGGHVYVCGDVTMAADVSLVIQTIPTKIGKMTLGDARDWVTSLKVRQRQHVEKQGENRTRSEKRDLFCQNEE